MSLISFVGMYLLSGIIVFCVVVIYEMNRSYKIDKANGNRETRERASSQAEYSLMVFGDKMLMLAFIAMIAMWPVVIPYSMVRLERNIFGK